VAGDYDVVVMGGGLAGLTLALQVMRRRPSTRLLVADRASHPVAEAAHKVGEATVENSAHYFASVLGLKDLLDQTQLRKMGLRFWPTEDPKPPLSERLEAGPSEFLTRHTYQLDRGRFENSLGLLVEEAGAEFLDGWRVAGFSLGSPTHAVTLARGEERREVTAPWIVDASGRRGLIKNALDLRRDVGHDCNAAWFRLGETIAMDDLIGEEDPPASPARARAWRDRVPNGQRWRATNHLMGRGYWAWLIPLSSGSISVGLVCDPRYVPLEELRDFDSLLAWFHRNEPELARAVERRRDSLQDYRWLKHFSHGCERCFSPDRWALTGEAGVFLDPLYSPGSDFIGLANTYITELVTRSLDGEDVGELAERSNRAYLDAFANALGNWEGQYGLMGNPQVWAAKAVWDTISYFAALNPPFVNGRLADCDFMDSIRPTWDRFQRLNHRVQAFFREWDERLPARNTAGFVDMASAVFRDYNAALSEPCDGEDLRRRIEANVAFLEDVARAMMAGAAGQIGLVVEAATVAPADFRLEDPRAAAAEPVADPEALARAAAAISHIWQEQPVASPSAGTAG
jgi:flavin-dependent dehydrogenase